MSDLIKITTKDGKQLVSARELYEGLKVQQDFTDWIKKQLDNIDAIENIDFTIIWYKSDDPFKKVVEFNGNVNSMVRKGFETDYVLTIDTAKEICMVVGITPRTNEETRKLSKKYRRYFIECEKKLKEVDLKANLLLAIYNGGQEGIAAAKKLTELEVEEATKPLLPKAEFYDKVLNPTDEENGFTKLLTTTEVAKDLGMTARQLNNILHEKRIIYKKGKTWVLYSKYDHLISEKYCDYFINEFGNLLKWTEKGRKFIIELLEK